MSSRSIISLQLGHYSNHIGAHFWNFQESSFVFPGDVAPETSKTIGSEVSHDVLYREGETMGRDVTYTPKLVCVDLKGALGSLPQFGDLYDSVCVPKTDSLLWSGGTVVQAEAPRAKGNFLKELEAAERNAKGDYAGNEADMDEQVRVWSDYLEARFHPKSVSLLREYQHGNALRPFDIFGLGTEAWKEGEGEEIEDRVRFFSEESDGIQGFHLLNDCFDGFGGLSTSLLDYLADEFSAKTVLSFPTLPCHFSEYTATSSASRLLNMALAVSSQAEHSTLITPLSLASDVFPLPGQGRKAAYLSYRPELMYHSSAVLAASLDTLSLPWRAKAGWHLNDLASMLNEGSRKIAGLSIALPLDLASDEYLVDLLKDKKELALLPLTPSVAGCHEDVQSQVLCLRGLGQARLCPPDFRSSSSFAGHPYLRSDSVQEALEQFSVTSFPRTRSLVSSFEAGVGVRRPFPNLFERSVTAEGSTRDSQARMGCVSSSPMLSCWQSSSAGGSFATNLLARAKKVNLNKLHRFREAGLEDDLLAESLEELASIADKYAHTDNI